MADRPIEASATELVVGLVGNPNTGKSTLFSGLCGVPARIGNYPGVTVEKKLGKYSDSAGAVTIIDLPGTYSLAARTLDEKVSVDVLLNYEKDVPPVDVIVAVVDATNLERNLYLFTQLREIGKPIVLVLNMWDRLDASDITINDQQLEQRLGVRVVTASASRREGLDKVKNAIREVAGRNTAPATDFLPDAVLTEIESIRNWVTQNGGPKIEHFIAQRLLLDRGGAYAEELSALPGLSSLSEQLEQSRNRLSEAGIKIASVEATSRYGWIRTQLTDTVTRPTEERNTTSDKIDRLMTHRVWGLLAFALIMFAVFQAITAGTAFTMDWITDVAQPWVASLIEGIIPPGTLRSLVNDGIVAGVGSVVVFLPQILMLFFFIGLLEDCGYMARAAFVMDKLMTKLGLSGKSFLPLMSSFACAVPGIMATRVIENRRDRMVTILVAPLMSCSARLPVYMLLTAAFIPNLTWLGGWLRLQGMVLFAMYLVGVVVAVPVAWLLKKFFFPGDVPPFVLELPSYKMPTPSVVFFRVWERAQAFLFRAGSLIFCTSILVWAAGYFPGDHSRLLELEQQLAGLNGAESAEAALLASEVQTESSRLIETSFLGRAGKAIAPVVRPLGWDWKIGVGVIASFPAREVIIATLGTIYSLGGDAEEESLQSAISSATWPETGEPIYTIPVALSIMVFFALCAQCAATLMVIKRETNSWGWPLFTFVYMTALAYVAAWLTYTIGNVLLG